MPQARLREGLFFERSFFLLIGVALLFVILLSAFVFCYAEPLSDDLIRSARVRDVGLIEAVKYDFVNWTGRWLGVGIVYFSTSLIDVIEFYPLLLSLPALMTIAGLGLFLDLVYGIRFPSRLNLFLCLTLFSVFWTGMPSTGQAFYWFTGAVENILPITLSLFLITGVLGLRSEHPGGPTILRFFVLGFLALAIPGIHELYGTLLLPIFLTGTWIAFKTENPIRYSWCWSLIFLVLGLALVYSAPGNTVRISDSLIRFRFDVGFVLALKEAILAFPQWVLDIRLLCGTILLLAFLESQPRPDNHVFAGNPELKWTLFILWLLVLALGFFGPGFAQGWSMPARTLTGLYYIFLLGWFTLVPCFTSNLRLGLKYSKRDNGTLLRICMIIFVLSLIFTGNSMLVIRDFNGRLQEMRRVFQGRYETARVATSRGQKTLVVQPVMKWPRSFFIRDISNNPEDPVNVGFAKLFGLESVRLEDPVTRF